MARQKKRLAQTNRIRPQTIDKAKLKAQQAQSLIYIELVEKVRSARTSADEEKAFERILELMRVKIEQISHKFTIPGLGLNDIRQEALFALRYKAIKDYDKGRSKIQKISPFDKFAMLCIRRHLSTKLKASYQNKSKVLNSSISLDQDRNTGGGSDDSLYLADILPRTENDILVQIRDHEYYAVLISRLFSRLSRFEKQVLLLYMRRYSYQEISDKINHCDKRYRANVKSVDNALSRIKNKAKDVFDRYG